MMARRAIAQRAVGAPPGAGGVFRGLQLVENLPRYLNSGSSTDPSRSCAGDDMGVRVAGFDNGWAARSIDFGKTWSALPRHLNSGVTGQHILSMDTDGAGVYVAIFHIGGASRSTDYGATWTGLPRGLNSGSTTAQFRRVATDKQGTWVVVSQNGYCSRSLDNGATWTALPRGLGSGSTSRYLYGIDFDGTGKIIVACFDGYATWSLDNGDTWDGAYTGDTKDFYDAKITSSGRFVVVGQDWSIRYSADQGGNWSAASLPDVQAFGSYSDHWVQIVERHGVLIAFPIVLVTTDVGDFCCPYYSYDDGLTWYQAPIPMANLCGNAIEEKNSQQNYIGDEEAIFTGMDGYNYRGVPASEVGQTALEQFRDWEVMKPIGLNSGSSSFWANQIVAVNDNILVATLNFGYSSRTIDGGSNWSTLTRGLNCGSTSVSCRHMEAGQDDVIIGICTDGYATRGTDQGATWTGLPRGLNSGSSSFTDDDASVNTDGAGVWVAGWANTGWMSRSIDNGLTWSALPNLGSDGPRYVHYAGSNTWYLCGKQGGIYRSIDNGASFQQVFNSGHNDQIASIACDGNVCIAVGSVNRAFRSIDGGENWAELPQHLSMSPTGTNTNLWFGLVVALGDGRWIVFPNTTRRPTGSASGGKINTAQYSPDDGDTWYGCQGMQGYPVGVWSAEGGVINQFYRPRTGRVYAGGWNGYWFRTLAPRN